MYQYGINPEETISLGGSKKRVEFGNLVAGVNEVYPITTNWINQGINSRVGSPIRGFYSNFSRMLWEIEWDNNQSNARVVSGLQFATENDIVNYLNSNTANNGSTITEGFIVRSYAYVTDTISIINKINGINRFYSVLKGNKKYKQFVPTLEDTKTAPNGNKWTYIDAFVDIVWKHFYPGIIINAINRSSAAKSIWFPRNHYNLYAPRNIGQTIEFLNGNHYGRYSWNWGTSDFGQHNSDSLSVTGMAIAFLHAGQYTFASNNITTYPMGDNFMMRSYSMILISKIEGNNKTALYITPIGTDMWLTNYINNYSNYRLYLYGYNAHHDEQPIVRDITSLVDTVGNLQRDLGYRVKKENIYSFINNTASTNHIGFNSSKKFRLFIGDDNGNISTLSAEVEVLKRMSGGKIRSLVGKYVW